MSNQAYREHKVWCSKCAAVDDAANRVPRDGLRRCAQGAFMVKQLVAAGEGAYAVLGAEG